jgi:hypothetical protein
MATQNLIKQGGKVDTSMDNIIIHKVIETLPGGRTLDVTGFPDATIQAGHVIIKENGEYKPQPIDGSKDALAVGVLMVSIEAAKPEAAIMTRGTVNQVQLKYPINAATKAALSARIGYVIND